MNSWTLIDCVAMAGSEDELPKTSVESEEQLRHELNRYRQRQPASIIELVSPAGDVLQLGISHEFSGARWMKSGPEPTDKQLKMAIADRKYSQTGMEFRFQGSESSFRQQYVLPVEKTIEVAAYFFRTGHLPDWIQWTEWNPKKRRLEVPTSANATGIAGVPQLALATSERTVHMFCPTCSAVLQPPEHDHVEQVCPHCRARMATRGRPD